MELTDYVRILRTHWVAIVIFTLVGGALGIGWAALQPKEFTASASGIITTGTSEDLGTAMSGDHYARARVKSYLDVASSLAVAALARDALGLDDSPNSLIARISVSNPLDTPTIKVSAKGPTPEAARDLAEAWIQAIGVQIAEFESTGNDGGFQDSIITFRTLDTAQLPVAPSFPNTKLAGAVGLALGLSLGVIYALIRNIFDRRISSSAEVERQTGASVVGTIPYFKKLEEGRTVLTTTGGNDQRSGSAEEYSVAEALRELRTNLQFMNIDNPPRKIVVTSSLPGEGKSVITANLAATIAQSGERVIAIDADLRRPMLARTFGLVHGIGLTDYLVGRAPLEELLQPWGSTGNLMVLGAGKIPPNPSELLSSDTMKKFIDELAEHATVLIDAPPLLPVTDASILAARTDGALIVGYSGRTTYDALTQALGNLEKVKGKALGVIINGIPLKGTRSEGYGYQYRYRYGSYYGRQDATPESPQPDTRAGRQRAAAMAGAATRRHRRK